MEQGAGRRAHQRQPPTGPVCLGAGRHAQPAGTRASHHPAQSRRGGVAAATQRSGAGRRRQQLSAQAQCATGQHGGVRDQRAGVRGRGQQRRRGPELCRRRPVLPPLFHRGAVRAGGAPLRHRPHQQAAWLLPGQPDSGSGTCDRCGGDQDLAGPRGRGLVDAGRARLHHRRQRGHHPVVAPRVALSEHRRPGAGPGGGLPDPAALPQQPPTPICCQRVAAGRQQPGCR